VAIYQFALKDTKGFSFAKMVEQVVARAKMDFMSLKKKKYSPFADRSMVSTIP
jgi:hypothetical protein